MSGIKSFFQRVPPWAISLLIHLIILIVLALLLRTTVVVIRGADSDRTAEVGIELKSRVDGKTYYQSAEEFEASAAAQSQGNQSSQKESAADIASELSLDADPTSALPGALGITADDLGGGLGSDLDGVLSGPGDGSGGVGSALENAGKGEARCFGTTGTGRRFVYVFDRSGSMGGGSRSALGLAKRELIRSFNSLTPQQEFLIVFYNQDTSVFPSKDLALADSRGKRNAESFVNAISAIGGTDHMEALKRALACRPDVIFFLTDADEPVMSAGNLAEIKRRARDAGGVQINSIEFGVGEKSSPNGNFIERLAQENGGQYIYIDVSSN